MWLESTACAQEKLATAGMCGDHHKSVKWDPKEWNRLSPKSTPVPPVKEITRDNGFLFTGRSYLLPVSALLILRPHLEQSGKASHPAVVCMSCQAATFEWRHCTTCHHAVWCEDCANSPSARMAHAFECSSLQQVAAHVAEALIRSDLWD